MWAGATWQSFIPRAFSPHSQDLGKASPRAWSYSQDRMGPHDQKAFGGKASHPAHRCCQIVQGQGQRRPPRQCSPLQKRMKVRGKFTWQAPVYVRIASHKCPKTGKKIRVKAGTQVIDRAWRFLKDRVHVQSNSKVGSATLKAQIRSAQYEYWHMGQDLWQLTGSLFQWELEKFVLSA